MKLFLKLATAGVRVMSVLVSMAGADDYVPRLRKWVAVAMAVAIPSVKAPICSCRYMRKTWLFHRPSFWMVVASYRWR